VYIRVCSGERATRWELWELGPSWECRKALLHKRAWVAAVTAGSLDVPVEKMRGIGERARPL
jgi:hypothetical protein